MSTLYQTVFLIWLICYYYKKGIVWFSVSIFKIIFENNSNDSNKLQTLII